MKISICVAVYNGEKYLHKQIDSILTQIALEDQIIVINDTSTDNSMKILESFNDPRISIYQNSRNLGVVTSFEKAINIANGEIIFLSDQDDIWLPNKVRKVLEIFNSRPAVTLVLSDAQIIDDEDIIIASSYFSLRGEFSDNLFANVIKNKYHGCTMAFKREILDFVLPFPNEIPMHDMWIGIVNSIYGKTFYINESLMQHRRHGNNTGRGFKNSASLFSILKWRFTLIKNLLLIILDKRHE
jgi:glycosyltransferase involved in cell wall biosynthesis